MVVHPASHRVPRVPWYSGYCPGRPRLRVRAFHPLRVAFPKPFHWHGRPSRQSITPGGKPPGLGSSHFARRYFGNRCFFLFLRLLRCFSSPGSPRTAMCSPCGSGGPLRWVAPFRNLRVIGYLLLAAAYRSLSRLSSALSAKASALRPFLLDLPPAALVLLRRLTAAAPCLA